MCVLNSDHGDINHTEKEMLLSIWITHMVHMIENIGFLKDIFYLITNR